MAEETFYIRRFGRSCLGFYTVGTLASVILLISLTKTRQYYDADKMLQKATTKDTFLLLFLRKLGKKLQYITL